MNYRPIISIKDNELQKDCFMYELKQLMKKYGLVSLGTKQGAITIIDDSISANGMHFEIQENVFDQKQKCDFTPCFMEEYFKV
jgi:hypothetical protein